MTTDETEGAAMDFGDALQAALAHTQGHQSIVVDQTDPATMVSLRRARFAAQDTRATLLLENANLRDDIARHQPKSGYLSADWHGRIARMPVFAKRYLTWTRTCLAHLAASAAHTVSITQGHSMGVAEFHEEWRAQLDKRINSAGHVKVREPRDGEWTLCRDQQTIEDYLQRRIRMHYLGSRLVKKRLPDLVAIAHANQRDD